MAQEAMAAGRVQVKLARRFVGIGIGVALAASVISYVTTWAWSGSMGRFYTELLTGFEGERYEMKASEMLARQLDEFMRERIADVQNWASAPTVVSAARQAHSVHDNSGLLAIPVEDIEQKFQIRKSLGRFPIANSYLRAEITRSKYFDRILFTDRNGFNVVVTNANSDFVQSDESWWQRTWSDGFSIGAVQYDDSMDAWAIDISVRIDDPATEDPVGVMQATLSIALIQQIANQYSGRGYGERVTVVDDDGLLVAETSSQHSATRIMNEKARGEALEDSVRRAVFGTEHSGQLTGDKWATGYSRTASREFYADLTRDFRFPGFQWTVIVQSEKIGALTGIEAATEKLAEWRKFHAGILAGSFLALAFLAGGIGWWMAGRITRPIRYLHTVAQQMSLGRATGAVYLDTNDELSGIASALERMRRTIQAAVRIVRDKRKAER